MDERNRLKERAIDLNCGLGGVFLTVCGLLFQNIDKRHPMFLSISGGVMAMVGGTLLAYWVIWEARGEKKK